MKSIIIPRWKSLPSWLRSFVVVLLVLGIFFRFANLDRKVYWYDETHTSLRVSGYTEAEAVKSLSTGNIIHPEALQKYQRPNPEKGVLDTIRNLAVEDAQHPPLYYVSARFWIQWFGSSATAIRSLSALISLLAFPCIYWLCLELFESPLTGWVAVALLAVSPVHVLFAQEARQYSLWTVTILLSSAALLRAMRVKTKLSWVIYSVTVVANLYTFLFSGLVLLGQAIYVVAVERCRLSKTLIGYLVASLAALFAFVPWLLVVIRGLSQIQNTTAWVATKNSKFNLIREWIFNLNRIFLDWNYASEDKLIYKIIFYFSSLVLLVLVGYSLYFLWRNTPLRVWLFVFTLTGSTGLTLILSDVILGGVRSTIGRYLFPCFLGIQLAVAYLFATKLSGVLVNIKQQKLWQIAMIAIASSGVLSCAILSQADVWWSKYQDVDIPIVAGIINQATRPLVISDAQTGEILSLSYQLNPKVQLLIEPLCTNCGVTYASKVEPRIRQLPEGFSDVFFFNTDGHQKWLNQLAKEQGYPIKPMVFKGSNPREALLWRLEKQ